MGSPPKNDSASHLPLTPTVYYILLALVDEDRHGYGIMQEVAARTNGQMHLGPGTLYGAIKRLLKNRLIAEVDQRPDPALDDERRRYYRLTDFGLRVLRAEIARLDVMLRQAHDKQLLSDRSAGPNLGEL